MTSIRAVRALPFDQTGLKHTTARTIARLLRIAHEMRVDVQWRDLGEYRRGEYRDGDSGRYYDGTGLIVLSDRLQGFQVANTLGHEIAHAMFGDRASTPETEERAARVGAAIAVDPAHFRRMRLANRVAPKAVGLARCGLEALGATPHADGGCPCFPCREFRATILREVADMREDYEHFASGTVRLVEGASA
jgi:hypothetical protein